MLFTPEERRALLLLGSVLVFGQALAWWEEWRLHQPDRELSAWLDEVARARAAADSTVQSLAAVPGESGVGPEAASAHDGPKASAAGADSIAPRGGGAAATHPPGAADDQGVRTIPAHPREALPPGLLETGRIRLDLATAEELASLPGIGPALAARIVAAREEAPFRTVDDLLRVKGIGPKTLAKFRHQLSVESPPAPADSTRGEQRLDAAESRRGSQVGAGGAHR